MKRNCIQKVVFTVEGKCTSFVNGINSFFLAGSRWDSLYCMSDDDYCEINEKSERTSAYNIYDAEMYLQFIFLFVPGENDNGSFRQVCVA